MNIEYIFFSVSINTIKETVYHPFNFHFPAYVFTNHLSMCWAKTVYRLKPLQEDEKKNRYPKHI